MAITDPTIDPITGLPVFDLSGIVQQIPLGRQTTDFASWNATAQPTRGPLFPDDGYPVFSNVQGQHPQTGNAQSVNTDGNHALLVKDVSGGGGGGGLVPIAPFPENISGLVLAGDQTQISGNFPLSGVTYLYGIQIVTQSFASTGNYGSFTQDQIQLLLKDQSSATAYPIANILVSSLGDNIGKTVSERVFLWFGSEPWLLATMFPGSASLCISVIGPLWEFAYSVQLYFA